MAMIDKLLRQMVTEHASDLHMSTGQQIRMRLHGDLVPISEKVVENTTLQSIMKEICREDQWKTFEETSELDFAYGIEGVSRFRCNYFKHARGLGAVYRIIPEKIMTLEELNLPRAMYNLLTFNSGLVLVTGPTGSGKSTTLAAVINEINENQSKMIVTVEDPVEFVHPNKRSRIFQREVGADTPGFFEALRDALHQDPDVILVGEMRDLETISLALKAAEMGVLVFGTLHTNSAPKTIDRIIDVFPSQQQEQVRSMLAESLKAIASQQLLRTADGHGRVCAVELMVEGPGLTNIIRDGAISKLYSYMQTHRSLGMQIMDEALMRYVLDHVVSPTEAYRKANDKKTMQTFFDEKGINFDVDEAFKTAVAAPESKRKIVVNQYQQQPSQQPQQRTSAPAGEDEAPAPETPQTPTIRRSRRRD